MVEGLISVISVQGNDFALTESERGPEKALLPETLPENQAFVEVLRVTVKRGIRANAIKTSAAVGNIFASFRQSEPDARETGLAHSKLPFSFDCPLPQCSWLRLRCQRCYTRRRFAVFSSFFAKVFVPPHTDAQRDVQFV